MKDALSNLYCKAFTWEDHVDLARLNHESEHQIIITYDNHDKVRELYSDWYIIEENYRYFVDLKKKRGTELLISNRPFKKYLHNVDHPITLKKQTDFTHLLKKVE